MLVWKRSRNVCTQKEEKKEKAENIETLHMNGWRECGMYPFIALCKAWGSFMGVRAQLG